MKEKIEKSIRILDFVITQSDKTANYFYKQKRDSVTMFCLCMIDRLHFSSVSLKALLKVALENSKVEYGCGIILRSVFLDTIILLNAFEITGSMQDDMQNDLSKFCFDMLGDSVKHTYMHFKEDYDQGLPEIKNMYKNLVLEHPEFFEPYIDENTAPVLKKIKRYTNKELVNNIRSSKDLNKNQDLYNAYSYYSKYDHFGQMFHSLSQKDFQIRLDNVNSSITRIPRALLFAETLLLLSVGRDALLEFQYNEIRLFVEAI